MSDTVVTPQARSPRHLLQWVLALVVAATTVSMAPAPAQAAPGDPLDLVVSSLGRDVTLVTTLNGVVSGVTGATGLSDARVTFTSAADQTKTWVYKLPATTLAQLGQPTVLDMDAPGLQALSWPATTGTKLPDGDYVVRTSVTTLGGLLGGLLGGILTPILTLLSDTVTTTLTTFTVPGAPTGVLFPAPANGSSPISWLAPADGGSAITTYVVKAVDALGTVLTSCTTTTTTCNLTGLTDAVAGVLVTATNAIGTGIAGGVLAPVVGGGGSGDPDPAAPTAPAGVTAVAGNGAATVSWAASTSADLPVTGYTVTATPGARTCFTTTLTCTVDGLVNGTAYTFTAEATALVRRSVASAPSAPVTPATVPGAPTWQPGTVSSDQATLRWSAPSTDGGSAVTGYRVTVAGRQLSTSGTSLNVAGLAPSTSYVADVVAVNARGASAPVSQQVTTGAAPKLAAAITPVAKRSGARAALVRVDLNRAATVKVRVVRGKTVASRTVALSSAPTWVSVPVAKKSKKLLDGRRVTLEVRSTGGAVVKAVGGKVKR